MTLLYANEDYREFVETFEPVRSPAVDMLYQQRLENISYLGKTPGQYILENLFEKNQRIAIQKNQFPYNIPYAHYVAWSLVADEGLVETVVSMFDNVVCIFENDFANRSVGDLSHYHFFVDTGSVATEEI